MLDTSLSEPSLEVELGCFGVRDLLMHYHDCYITCYYFSYISAPAEPMTICSQLSLHRNMAGNVDNAVFVITINFSHLQLLPLHSLSLKMHTSFIYFNYLLDYLEGGPPSPLDSSWYLQLVLRGCKRVLGLESLSKLSITMDILLRGYSRR